MSEHRANIAGSNVMRSFDNLTVVPGTASPLIAYRFLAARRAAIREQIFALQAEAAKVTRELHATFRTLTGPELPDARAINREFGIMAAEVAEQESTGYTARGWDVDL